MKFTPNHWVAYKGNYLRAGEAVEIDPMDAQEMAQYGKVEAVQAEAEPAVRQRKKKNAE